MSDVSPQDREQLAKIKFSEFAQEFLQSDAAAKWFDEKVNAMHEAAGTTPQPPRSQQVQPSQSVQRPQRKRSLLEECFSQTFGMS